MLVDCTRGLCREDRSLLSFLNKANKEWCLVLTKGDLMHCRDLAAAIQLVEEDLIAYGLLPAKECARRMALPVGVQAEDANIGCNSFGVFPVSASTGAGIHALWLELRATALLRAAPSSGEESAAHAVREHAFAGALRKHHHSDNKGYILPRPKNADLEETTKAERRPTPRLSNTSIRKSRVI